MSLGHISVVRSMLVWLVSAVFILVGFVSLSGGSGSTGLGLIVVGLVVGVLNKLVFRVRSKQVEIDAHEAVRDGLGAVCQSCGQRQPQSSKFCNNCGHQIG